MRELSQEEERWLSLGKEYDLHRRLKEWRQYREARYTDYLRLKNNGVTSDLLDAMDAELREINDKVYEIADEYEAQLNYNRSKGWS